MPIGKLFRALLPPEDKRFYDFFEEAASVCHEASALFKEIIKSQLSESNFIQAKTLKARSDDIAKRTIHEVNRTFVTPIEREDLLELTFRMNKICKRIVRSCINLKVYRISVYPDIMKRQAETLINATAELKVVMELLAKGADLKQMDDHNHKMIEIENHGDDILSMAMDELFSGRHEAVEIIKFRDIFRDIESALDNCSNVSETVLNIVLKHG